MESIERFKDFLDRLSGPTTVFWLAVLIFLAMIQLRAWWTRPGMAAAIAAVLAGAILLCLGDPNFAEKVLRPDGIAILILLGLLFFCLWVAFRKMALNDGLLGRGLPSLEARESSFQVFSWPDLIYVEFLAALAVSILLILWSVSIEAPLDPPADPARSPNPAKAPWYFLGLQELLVYFDPPWGGVLFPCLIVLGLAAIPYLDPNPRGNGSFTFRERPLAISIFLFGFLVLWILPILIGAFFRGPNWGFYGPFEVWDRQKIEPLVSLNLSDLTYRRLLGSPLPRSIFLRELPGILLVAVYFLALPPILGKTIFRRSRREVGFLRYQVFALLLLLMMSLPLKMTLRWILNLKYVVAIPEGGFNL